MVKFWVVVVISAWTRAKWIQTAASFLKLRPKCYLNKWTKAKVNKSSVVSEDDINLLYARDNYTELSPLHYI